MKGFILKIVTFVLLLLFSISLVSCSKEEEEKVIVADQTFEIHTELQRDYLAGDFKLISLFAKGKEELSKPQAINLSWDSNASSYKVYLSESKDFNSYVVYESSVNNLELYNLKINTLYYWYVEYELNSELVKSDTKTFVIDQTIPRNLNIDGVTNARDLGGYKLGVNKYVKQGMIYRTARYNENETQDLLITDNGIKEMVEILKIKSELDIRRTDNNENGGLTSSPLGSGVNYYSLPMKSGGNILLLNKDMIKDVFAVLGNEANYPVVIHCSIGTDRTGLICFLINALLGVSEEDLYRDYLFSNFGNIGGSRSYSIIDTYIMNISSAQGDSLADRTYNYLLGIGVSKTDLDKVINIMTEKR